jgi:predicted nucleic acid-binding Zn ribbon protein
VKRRREYGPPRFLFTRPAAAAVADALRLHGIGDEVRAHRLVTDWIELVGDKIASRTRPGGIYERILHIEVATSAWLHELNLLRPQLLAGLLQRFGEPRLFDELRFKLAGRTRRESMSPRPSRPPPRVPREPPVVATGAVRDAIIRDVAVIDDDDLRELIARVRIAHSK